MSRASAPLDALWQAPALIWILIFGEGLGIVLASTVETTGSRWVAFGLYSMAIQWISLLTLGVIYLLRYSLRRLRPPVTAMIVMLILLACAWSVGAAGWTFSIGGLAQGDNPLSQFMLKVTIITLTTGLLGLAAFQNYWQSRQAAVRAKQAELEALQARIHPHFLFNTLNSAAALVHARPDDAERVLLDLGDLFRAALSEPGWVPVAHELDLCRRYLAIEQQRFGDRLRVEWRVDEGLDGLSVPLLTIQPLVENAVAHGLDERSGVKSLRVEATQTAADLVVSVRNAVPRDATAVDRNGHSVGLAGVRARVESVTQGTGSVATESDGSNFVVRIVLPKAAMPVWEPAGAH